MATPNAPPFPFPVPAPDPSDGGFVLLAALAGLLLVFAAREVVGGALRAAGADLWAWAKRRARR